MPYRPTRPPEPRELGSEDPGRPAEFQAVVVDELLRLAPHGYDIPLHQDVDTQVGYHGNVERHFPTWACSSRSEREFMTVMSGTAPGGPAGNRPLFCALRATSMRGASVTAYTM